MTRVTRSLTTFLLETISEPPNLIHIIIEHASRPSVLQITCIHRQLFTSLRNRFPLTVIRTKIVASTSLFQPCAFSFWCYHNQKSLIVKWFITIHIWKFSYNDINAKSVTKWSVFKYSKYHWLLYFLCYHLLVLLISKYLYT